jgi:Protein of unknown function (DUF2946)
MGGRVMRRISRNSWGRVFACVLAYALVLQGFFFAFGMGRPAIAAAENAALPGFALCTHHGDGSALPGAPSQNPVGDQHCPFCIAGASAGYVKSAPPIAPEYRKVALTNATWPLAPQRLVAFLVNESSWPRGPPAAA